MQPDRERPKQQPESRFATVSVVHVFLTKLLMSHESEALTDQDVEDFAGQFKLKTLLELAVNVLQTNTSIAEQCATEIFALISSIIGHDEISYIKLNTLDHILINAITEQKIRNAALTSQSLEEVFQNEFPEILSRLRSINREILINHRPLEDDHEFYRLHIHNDNEEVEAIENEIINQVPEFYMEGNALLLRLKIPKEVSIYSKEKYLSLEIKNGTKVDIEGTKNKMKELIYKLLENSELFAYVVSNKMIEKQQMFMRQLTSEVRILAQEKSQAALKLENRINNRLSLKFFDLIFSKLNEKNQSISITLSSRDYADTNGVITGKPNLPQKYQDERPNQSTSRQTGFTFRRGKKSDEQSEVEGNILSIRWRDQEGDRYTAFLQEIDGALYVTTENGRANSQQPYQLYGADFIPTRDLEYGSKETESIFRLFGSLDIASDTDLMQEPAKKYELFPILRVMEKCQSLEEFIDLFRDYHPRYPAKEFSLQKGIQDLHEIIQEQLVPPTIQPLKRLPLL